MLTRTWSRVFLLFSLAACAARAAELPRARVVLPSGRVLQAEVASDDGSRAQGLMFRSEAQFQPHQAMVFLFPEPRPLGFWMKNVNFAIDIVWCTGDLRVIHVERDVPPCTKEPCKNYGPARDAQVVVELYRGTVAKERLAVGDMLQLLDGAAE